MKLKLYTSLMFFIMSWLFVFYSLMFISCSSGEDVNIDGLWVSSTKSNEFIEFRGNTCYTWELVDEDVLWLEYKFPIKFDGDTFIDIEENIIIHYELNNGYLYLDWGDESDVFTIVSNKKYIKNE